MIYSKNNNGNDQCFFKFMVLFHTTHTQKANSVPEWVLILCPFYR